jgi:hypothetical protein
MAAPLPASAQNKHTMTGIRQTIKQNIPAPIWQPISRARYTLQRAAQWPAATFHPLRRHSIQRLADFKDLHSGERCFIIGNGPSLQQTDLHLLRDEFTFGMNRIYLLFAELGFPTSYYLSINSLVIEQCAADIYDLDMPKFLSWRSHKFLDHLITGDRLSENDPIFLHTTYTGPGFTRDARKRLWEGATVTYVALQLAFFMGFHTVILIGVDHSFSTQGKPNTTIVSEGDDRDHFHTAYFGKGFRWQLPDLDTSEQAYRMARDAYGQAGRQVLDATIGGKLTVFPKVDYTSLF